MTEFHPSLDQEKIDFAAERLLKLRNNIVGSINYMGVKLLIDEALNNLYEESSDDI